MLTDILQAAGVTAGSAIGAWAAFTLVCSGIDEQSPLITVFQQRADITRAWRRLKQRIGLLCSRGRHVSRIEAA